MGSKVSSTIGKQSDTGA